MTDLADLMSDLLSKTIDVDSHEQAPTHHWGEMFGPNSVRFAELAGEYFLRCNNNPIKPGLEDSEQITSDSVWEIKGHGAPGAIDFERRLEVLDVMGTDRQFVFPSAALLAFNLLHRGQNGLLRETLGVDLSPEIERILTGTCDEYNDWALRTTVLHGERYRPAAMILATTVPELMAQAEQLLSAGARALWLPTAHPPAGRSPADHDLDPFWSMAEMADVPVVLHVGTEDGMLATEQWSKAPEFATNPNKIQSIEIRHDPFDATMMCTAPVTYLTAMVMGGVFERHPRLRFGVIELGATWFGSLAEHLDVWAETPFSTRMSSILSMRPSDYFARNIRVTPFYFENVGTYFERYPNLQDCYCYNTDYPHKEGGQHTKQRFYDMVRPFGPEIVEKFFVRNGEWLIPS